MARPGTDVAILDAAPPRSAPQTTDAAFFVGFTDKGPLGPALTESLTDFHTRWGARITWGSMYDAAEVYFREGGSRLYISRVTGPSAVAASRTLSDGSAVASLKVSANSPGPWGNSLTVQVASVTGGYQITIRDTSVSGSPIIDQSPTLVTKNDAIDWGAAAGYTTISVAGAGGVPAVLSASALSGGTDDHASATDTDWIAAVARFSKNLGPGQIAAPGNTSTTLQATLLNHAFQNNRWALIDAPDSPTLSTVTAAPPALRTAAGNDAARFGEIVDPWIRIPGLAAGTTREAPPSAYLAALYARSDLAGNPIGQPPANINGVSRGFVIGVNQARTPADVTTLYNAQVNSITLTFNGYALYGDTSLADPTVYPLWRGSASNRVVTTIAARADAIMQNHVFALIDGQGLEFTKLAGELVGMLVPLWQEGSLYGATFDEAARVDTGPKVNTPTTIANRELHATIAVKTSPAADWVQLNLVRVATTETL